LVFINGSRCSRCGNIFRGDLIVNPPTDVFGPCLAPVAPPRISFARRVGIQSAIYVHPADLVDDTRQLRTYYRMDAAVFLVAFLVLQVDFLVGDVPVAAKNDLTSTFGQFFQVLEKVIQNNILGRLAVVAAGAGRQIQGNDRQVFVYQLQIPAFGVYFGYTQAFDNLQWLGASIDAYTAVAFFLGVVEIPVISRRIEHVGRHVVGLGFEFLHANEVGALGGDPVQEAFADG